MFPLSIIMKGKEFKAFSHRAVSGFVSSSYLMNGSDPLSVQ